MKVVLIGATGQLGTDIIRVFDERDLTPLTHAQLDVCDGDATRQILRDLKPDVVINTSAYHKVDECEDKVHRSFEVNAYAVRNLAQVCADIDATLVHLSTDYVFGGCERQTPWSETDAPCPINVYGISKLAGENFARYLAPKHFVIRTTGLYGIAGASGKGGNFVELMIRLAKEGKPIRVVTDQVLTPTYTRDLALKIKELIQTEAYGLYHLTSGGSCAWYEFARTIFELLDRKPDFGPTTSASFPTRARRPAYSVLAHDSLLKAGLPDLRPWPEALEAYLREKGHLGQVSAAA